MAEKKERLTIAKLGKRKSGDERYRDEETKKETARAKGFLFFLCVWGRRGLETDTES